jgi:hypothetical protein
MRGFTGQRLICQRGNRDPARSGTGCRGACSAGCCREITCALMSGLGQPMYRLTVYAEYEVKHIVSTESQISHDLRPLIEKYLGVPGRWG